jgi:flagellum-specific ATP synthase
VRATEPARESGRVRALINEIATVPEVELYGRVQSVQGLLVEIAGPVHAMSIGSRVTISGRGGAPVDCEVVGFRNSLALCMPFSTLDGVRMGCKAVVGPSEPAVRPLESWLGRVINAAGEPIDGKGPLAPGPEHRRLRSSPPPAHMRTRVVEPIDLGVRALNSFATCCKGQRMGIFAGSGVGKSVLLSMLARNTACDVSVIGLIGERGREVQEFIEDDLGPDGLKRSIVIVSTSDEPALMRRQAAYLTLTLAEYFRDLDRDVLCLIDSVTRFAMAQREIGLSGGEPPTTKGYTPTVFAELPRLLERAGPGTGKGSITGLFTVLVEGDDHNEPVADAVRSILDGHIVMERSIAERGRYPAINVLRSISRTMPGCVPEAALPVVRRARRLLATYGDMEELIRLGAYRPGSDATIDEAIHFQPFLEDFLGQRKEESTSLSDGYDQLARILNDDGHSHNELQRHAS